ncbi:MAG: hypothetical protein A2061_09325 [Gallionellales bacterium GWA2_59_43]|nr:MAG: hypothetical protein A2061_09325 [Gallionellales bacterium GWA2_59_43]
MAMRNAYSFDGFMPAIGTQLPVAQYQAVMSLIGNTYGGDGIKNINLPDLRGRVILGAGIYTDKSGSKNYQVGQTGGLMASSVVLAAANLPPHLHALSSGVMVNAGIGTLKVSLTGLSATATAGTLAGSTTLAGITATGASSSLTLNASTNSSAATASPTPSNSLYLGSPGARIYNAASTPLVALAPSSLSGTVPVTFTGTAAVSITGAPAVTVTGNPSLTGAPSVAIGGQTDATGGGAAVTIPTMMPYLVMNYYFATSGVYPVNNN